MSYPELADWLTAQSYPTKADEVRNAKRASLVVGVVPATLDGMTLLGILMPQFPALTEDKFLTPEEGLASTLHQP